MYLLAKFGGYRTYGNGDTNSYINSYKITSEKAEFAVSVHHIERFSKSGIPVYYSEVSDTTDRKTRRIQAIAKRFAFFSKIKTTIQPSSEIWKSLELICPIFSVKRINLHKNYPLEN